MRAVVSSNTRPELLLRHALREHGLLGYRVAPRSVLGVPDIVFTRTKLAIFVDGCYWHRCPAHCRIPKSNVDYWNRKIGKNVERDQATTQRLRNEGWLVVRFWEHEVINDPSRAALRVAEVYSSNACLSGAVLET
jgi:DNA mismatch endonuclease, patch repair protein